MTPLTPREKVLVEALRRWQEWDDNEDVAFLNSARKKTKEALATLDQSEEVCPKCQHDVKFIVGSQKGIECTASIKMGDMSFPCGCTWNPAALELAKKSPSREPSPDRATLDIEKLKQAVDSALGDIKWAQGQMAIKPAKKFTALKEAVEWLEVATEELSCLSSAPTQGARRWTQQDIDHAEELAYWMGAVIDLRKQLNALQGAPEDVWKGRWAELFKWISDPGHLDAIVYKGPLLQKIRELESSGAQPEELRDLLPVKIEGLNEKDRKYAFLKWLTIWRDSGLPSAQKQTLDEVIRNFEKII